MANRTRRATARKYYARLGLTEKEARQLRAPPPIPQMAVACMERAVEVATPKTAKKIADGLAAMKRVQRKPDSRERAELDAIEARAEEIARSMIEDALREMTPAKMAKHYEETNRRAGHDNPSDPALMAFRHEIMRAGMEADAGQLAHGMAFREFVTKAGTFRADELLYAQVIDVRWLQGYRYEGQSRHELLTAAFRDHTQPAREAARDARLTMPDGKQWPDVAREYERQCDPRTGEPWANRQEMYRFIANAVNKSPETVRELFNPRKRGPRARK